MTKSRLVALAVAVTLAGAVVSIPAGAQTAAQPETYLGKATGTALELGLFGQKVTLGFSEVSGDSKGTASAVGVGDTLSNSSKVEAGATLEKLDDDPEKACANQISLPGREELAVDLACGDAVAQLVNGVPNAVANGLVGAIDLNLAPELGEQVIAPVQEALEGIFGQLPEELNPVTDTVNNLLLELSDTGNLVRLEIGDSQSTLKSDAAKITSSALAEGARIDLFPGAGLVPEGAVEALPLASIIVGSAETTATYDRKTGEATPAFDPAIARVVLAAPLLGEVQEIAVQTGTPVTILDGTPLESTISLGAGSTSVDEKAKTVSAVADGVSLHLLKGVQGGVTLSLAHSASTVGGAPGTPAQVSPAVVELPRTGGTPVLPMVGLGLLGVALAVRRLAVGGRRTA